MFAGIAGVVATSVVTSNSQKYGTGRSVSVGWGGRENHACRAPAGAI